MSGEDRYRMRDVQRMLGVSRTVITRLVSGGLVQPTRGHGRETLFSFRDVVMLRTAHSLRKAGIPPRKIARALENLRATWSPDKDLTAIRITAVGADVAVHDRNGPWDAHTGQLLLNFEPTPVCDGPGNIREIQKRRAPGEFAAAAAREAAGDSDGAEAGYRRAIESDNAYLDAYLSLGCLLSEEGRYDEAIGVWRKALLEAPDHHLLHFNLGVALEDSGRLEQALIAYRRCIELKQDFADAHFNAARIHEVLGQQTHAIRHYNAYRTLNRDS
ncbi:MerR family transcriptional regulator [Burkholderia sp. MBR-1]|uniref:MerR family transcriptional regulator n=1 Tax=Burkholderia sp. MBR-1 TaxID=2732364 RepID=UPI0015EEE47D|nr:tetratricopeptide repeat protein [Burkholderia sp. MBR-1]QMI49678.1 tetratricopeptide repeat protein [Burkholderia sp. MBR-1]